MNLIQLRTFLAVARLNSFRKASEQLHATQPAISARIAGLEESLGTALFHRDGGAISLTAKGIELIPLAERLLTISEDVKQRIGGTDALSGVLRLGVAETLVHTWLPDFLRVLHGDYPNLDLDLTVDVSVVLRDALVSHSLDLAFLMGPVSEYSVSNLPLCSYPLVWVASPKLGLGGQELTMSDLIAFPLLTYARSTRPNAELADRLRREDGPPPRIFGSSSLSACRQMAVDGIGVGSMPAPYIAEDIQTGNLELLDVNWTPTDLLFTASFVSEAVNSLPSVIAGVAQGVSADYERKCDNKFLLK